MAEIATGNNLDKNHSRKVNLKTTKFQIKKGLYGSYRFGEYGIAGSFTGIQGDKIKYRISSDVDSYTMKAPLKQPIFMEKDIFIVPRQAILPRNWEKIKTNPSIGDDIDASEYGTSLQPIAFNRFKAIITNGMISGAYIETNPTKSREDSISSMTIFIKCVILNELVLGNGSLINALEAHTAELVHYIDRTSNKKRTGDYVLNEILRKFNSTGIPVMKVRKQNWDGTGTNDYFVLLNNTTYTPQEEITMSYREWLNELRSGEVYDIVDFGEFSADSGVMQPVDTARVLDLENQLATILSKYVQVNKQLTKPIDIAKLWAYQLICAEFYTNDKVDYIYNAELYRQYIGNIIFQGFEQQFATFQYNGVTTEVDYLSAHYFKDIVQRAGQGILYDTKLYTYFTSLFKYNRTIRFKDYFTGSRTRPIAIDTTGATTIEAGDNVEVINIVKGIQTQRLLNAVNKIPRDLAGYSKGIFGVELDYDYHNPKVIGKTREVIYGSETENTGEAQMTQMVSRTSTLKNQGGNYQFEFTLDRDSIIITVVWFDIERFYTRGIERSFMWVDRFDMFDPYMQYTGDQPVYKEEFIAGKPGTLGYQGAYMELKQGYNNAFGGLIETLPGWIFTDQYTSDNGLKVIREIDNQGPEFIRSKQTELDRFYISLAGETLAYYYHFIIDNVNFFEARRKMAYDPSILG